MKANGSIYVSVVLAALVAYFSYQWWFNPQRAIKRQLGELAATLSVPAEGASGEAHLARAARLRHYIAADTRVQMGPSGPSFASGDEIVQAFGVWTPPPGGLDVEFVDVQIALVSSVAARAFLTVELVGRDTRTGELARETREVRVSLEKRDGDWVVMKAEAAGPSAR